MHEVESMAFFGKVPWHGLGHQITNEEDLVDGVAFMKAAELDWTVDKISLKYDSILQNQIYDENEKGVLTLNERLLQSNNFISGKTVKNEYHLIRREDGAKLSTIPVTDEGYTIRQTSDMFAVFDPFLKSGEMKLHTAGSLFNGRKVWVLAELREGFKLPGEDVVNNFLLFTIHFSGKDANTATFTPIRVVCANTLRAALRKAQQMIRDSHKEPFDVQKMQDAVRMVKQEAEEYEKVCALMARCNLSPERVSEFFRKVYSKEEKRENKKTHKLEDWPIINRANLLSRGQDVQKKKGRKEIAEEENRKLTEYVDYLEAGGKKEEFDLDIATPVSNDNNPGWNLKSSEGTLWGAVNTVGYIEDHVPQKGSSDIDNHINRVFYPQQIDRKEKALQVAQDFLSQESMIAA